MEEQVRCRGGYRFHDRVQTVRAARVRPSQSAEQVEGALDFSIVAEFFFERNYPKESEIGVIKSWVSTYFVMCLGEKI